MANPRIHIIANCTDRKAIRPARELRLRSIPAVDAPARAELWADALRSWKGERMPAAKLYAGEHWSIAKELPQIAESKGLRAKLWVASAGYGLIDSAEFVAPYSATFSRRHPDTTNLGNTELGAWWTALTAGRKRESLQGLANDNPKDYFLVVCSNEYVRNMEADLSHAAKIVAERLVVVTSGVESNGLSVITTEAKLRREFGGSLISLNARVAKDVLSHCNRGLDGEAYRRRLKRLLANTKPLPSRKVVLVSDSAVRRFIRKETGKAGGWTGMLRLFRKEGYSCEQNRFRRIFRGVARA